MPLEDVGLKPTKEALTGIMRADALGRKTPVLLMCDAGETNCSTEVASVALARNRQINRQKPKYGTFCVSST